MHNLINVINNLEVILDKTKFMKFYLPPLRLKNPIVSYDGKSVATVT